MTDFKTKTMTTPKKMLAGATAVVALSGFVPAIEAASPTATANVGAEVVIQQAITINVGAPVNFGTIILSAVTVAGWIKESPSGAITIGSLTGEISHAGGNAVGTMAINSSAGAVNIALGAKPTDASGAILYQYLRFGGTAISTTLHVNANTNKTVNLVGGILNIGGRLDFISKPTPGTYTGKSFAVTVTDI